ncbi:hypothetical protein RRU01S_13_00190 [Agrobacterium rubi TR3 = NBRC 13261]|uniref:Uncharacterized protein n=1 Tax=Agrobacterium rubi TR3 = NBRC 13261 TaxID=1368415 RepID=A0A081CVI5_9HYPH|nr:hypothetical protein [Agrobacterium rubi]MBP1877644.1 hypothetical protein [Agrobacterium rubi]GAK70681.1 hypothetical protein RRU01S_13_00190 [Agrobacterium rubi TR3 = NBRC 13261]
MSRFNDTEEAVLRRLRALKAKPEMTINLLDLGTPLGDAGFTQDNIMEVLIALEQEKIIAFSTGNRLLILNKLPL